MDEIETLHDAGDPAARSLIEQSARYLGYAAVTMATLFDLDMVVLAGPSFAVAGSMSSKRAFWIE